MKRLLCVLLVCSLLAGMLAAWPVAAEEDDEPEVLSRGPENPFMDGEIREGLVLVTLYPPYNRRTEPFTTEDFPGVDVDHCDWSFHPTSGLPSETTPTGLPNYLMVYLRHHTVKATQNAVALLKQNPMVYDAFTVVFTTPDGVSGKPEINEYQWWLLSHDKTEEEQQALLAQDWVQQRLQAEQKAPPTPVTFQDGVVRYRVTMKQNVNRMRVEPTHSLGLEYATVESLYAPYDVKRLYKYRNAADFHATYLVTVEEDDTGFAYNRLMKNKGVLAVEPYVDPAETRSGPDVDGNGTLDAEDALLVLHCAVGNLLMTTDELYGADVDGNGVYNAVDALSLLQMAVGVYPFA